MVIVLENVRSMLNTGSVFRSADAFGATEIILCGITGTPPHREIQKTALGATETVSWRYMKDPSSVIEYLDSLGFTLFAVEQVPGSTLLTDTIFEREKKYAFVLGNEVTGVSESFIKRAAGVIEVPQIGEKKSLNISTCAGILLWEYFRQNSK